MLTCNKNFVDLTVWILRSWTCIKLNVYATSESGEGGSQETERQRIIQPHPTTVTQHQTERIVWDLNQTGSHSVPDFKPEPNWISSLENEAGNWTFWYLFFFFFAKLDVVLIELNQCVDRWDGRVAGFGWCFSGGCRVVACIAVDGVWFLRTFLFVSHPSWGIFKTIFTVLVQLESYLKPKS